jgi:nucleoside-diphosphate-sugar epimerase
MSTESERIMLVGATGLVGRALLQRLVDTGHRPTVVCRDPSRLPPSSRDRVQVEQGDFAGDAIEKAVQGAAVAINCAGLLSETAGREAMQEANVDGPERLLRAAAAAGVTDFLHISSASVYATPSGPALSEDSPLEPYPERRGAYTATKLEGERRLRDAAGSCRIRLAVMRPGIVYGPGTALPRGRLAVGMPAGRCLVLGGAATPFAVSHAENLADTVLAWLRRREPGTWNVVDDDTLTQGAWFKAWRRVRTDAPKPVFLPMAAALTLAQGAKLVGKGGDLPYKLRRILGPFRLDGRRVREELDWSPRLDLDAGLGNAGN